MKQSKIYALVIASAFLTGLSASAVAGKKAHHYRFKDIDANSDGTVTADEFKSFKMKKIDEHFKKMDLNGDGTLDKKEFKKARRKARKEMRKHRKKKGRKMKAAPAATPAPSAAPSATPVPTSTP